MLYFYQKSKKIHRVSMCVAKTSIVFISSSCAQMLILRQTSDRISQLCRFLTFWFLHGSLQLTVIGKAAYDWQCMTSGNH